MIVSETVPTHRQRRHRCPPLARVRHEEKVREEVVAVSVSASWTRFVRLRLGIEDLANCSGEVLAAEQLLDLARVGPLGIDAATRIVGFFVSAMGVGLIFQGVIEAFRDYAVLAAH